MSIHNQIVDLEQGKHSQVKKGLKLLENTLWRKKTNFKYGAWFQMRMWKEKAEFK